MTARPWTARRMTAQRWWDAAMLTVSVLLAAIMTLLDPPREW